MPGPVVTVIRPPPTPDLFAYLAKRALDALYTHHPALADRDGAFGAAERMHALHTHLVHLRVAHDCDTPALFREHLRWAASLAIARGGWRNDVTLELQVLAQTLEDQTDADLRALGVLLHAARARFESDPDDVVLPAPHDGPLTGLLLGRLLADDAAGADALLRGAFQAMGHLPAYLQVVTPVMHEIGRLWQCGTISAATEHRSTVTMERVLERLRATAVPADTGSGRIALVGSTPGESHTVAVGMIADLLQSAGWQVHRLGQDATAAEVGSTIARTGADLVVLSIVRSAHFGGLCRLVADLRARPDARGARVMVGGAPFAALPGLRAKVAADAVGSRLDELLPLAERLLAA